MMEEKYLNRIAHELMKLNRNFEKLMTELQAARNKVAEPAITFEFGSMGESEPSEK